jgi:hydrogenase maturation protease
MAGALKPPINPMTGVKQPLIAGKGMKSAAIIGFGDVLQGDLGAGCYVLDALTQTLHDSPVELVYLADGYTYAASAVFQKDLCIFVQALDLGCTAGSVQCWSFDAFLRNLSRLVACQGSLQLLAESLARAELAGGMPQKTIFIWLQPEQTTEIGLSKKVRKGLRKVIALVREELCAAGLLPLETVRQARLYRIDLLNCSI